MRTQIFVVPGDKGTDTVLVCLAARVALAGLALSFTVNIISPESFEGFSTNVVIRVFPAGMRARKKPDPVLESGSSSRKLEAVL